MRWTLFWFTVIASMVRAHVGPPFPLFVDHKTGEDVVSVWADPDIGQALFYIVLETRTEGRPPDAPLDVALWTEPVSGRLPRARYVAQRQNYRNRLQYLAEPVFDQRDNWRIGVVIQRSRNDSEEIIAEVESTPPGAGPWDLLIYSLPFGFMGALWVAAMIRSRHRRTTIPGRPSE